MFPVEEALKERTHRLSSLILIAAVGSSDKTDRDQVTARYRSKNKLLTSNMEKGDS